MENEVIVLPQIQTIYYNGQKVFLDTKITVC